MIAAPPLAALDLIDALAGPLIVEMAPDALVTDVASTKGAIVARAETAGLRFVGGHPMAGREVGGFDAARPELFSDRPWVVVPASTARYGDRERIEALATACGGVPVAMSAGEHDAAVAAISHLPLVVAAALVEVGGRRRGRGGPPGLAHGREPRGDGLGGDDAPRPRRRRDGRRDRRDERPGDRGAAARPAGRPRRVAGLPRRPDRPRRRADRARFDEARNLLLASDAEAAE